MKPRVPSGDGPVRRPVVLPVDRPRAGGPVGNLVLAVLMLAWILSFGPEPQALATVPGVVGVLLLAERCRRWIHFVGWMCVFGALGIGYGYRWLAPTVQLFGGLSVVASWLVTALYGVAGTVHAWIAVLFYRGMLVRGRRPHPLTTVLLIVGAECLPVRLFPWMSGHGAVDVPPLRQAAEWGGVPAVSFVLLCLVVPIHEWLRGLMGAPARLRAAAATFALGAALFGVGLLRYSQVRSEDADATEHWRIGIVQADVGSLQKREDERRKPSDPTRSAAAYERGSRRAAEAGAELIVWPETAITHAVPTTDAQVTNYKLAEWHYDFLMELGAERAFLIGMYEKKEVRASLQTGKRPDVRYNVAAVRERGREDARWSIYRKVYLIPFGEAVPFGLPVRLPQDFQMVPGDMPQEPLALEGRSIVPFLCYEGILPEHVRRLAGEERPDLLASLANDSWFGDTWEPHQHLNFTRFRAVEHRAPLVRATNTGISAFVDASGEVVSRLGVGEEGVLLSEVPLVERGRTAFARFGWRLPWVAWIWVLAAWFWAITRPPRHAAPQP